MLVAMAIVGSLLGAASQALAGGGEDPILVDLSLEPSSSSVEVGEFVEIAIMASSHTPAVATISALDVLLQWDNDSLRLDDYVLNGGYEWLQAGWPNDVALDFLNEGATFPVFPEPPDQEPPSNDGDAVFQALAQFTDTAMVGPGNDLLVATLVFEAIQATPIGDPASVSIPEMLGLFSMSAVADGLIPGLDITGDLFGTNITVVPEPATLAMLGVGIAGFARRRTLRRR
jgi:hypothetical protein